MSWNRFRKFIRLPLKAEIVTPVCVFCGDLMEPKHMCMSAWVFIAAFREELQRFEPNVNARTGKLHPPVVES